MNSVYSSDFICLSKIIPMMKGLAILMIVNVHLFGYTKGYLSIFEVASVTRGKGIQGLLEAILTTIGVTGGYGVKIFIIASGFGLATSWWKKSQTAADDSPSKNSLNIKEFWLRRLSRIFPLYWLAHALALILAIINLNWVTESSLLSQGIGVALLAIFASLSTLRNFFIDYNFFINPAWWYVGLSVQLYLVFPLLIYISRKYKWSTLLLGSLILTLIYRLIIINLPLNSVGITMLLRGILFPSRLVEFVLGIVLAISLLEQNFNINTDYLTKKVYCVIHSLPLEARWIWLNLIFLITGVICNQVDKGSILEIPSEILIGLGEFCLFFQLFNKLASFKNFFLFNDFNFILKFIGDYSYGIYLIHMNVIRVLWKGMITLIPSYWLCFS